MPGPVDLNAFARDAVALLAAHREELDGLNVFPVPDADTGTNMYATLVAARDALASGQSFATGALLGARGNSGSILAAWLGPAVSGDLAAAAEAAYAAVPEPVEGTMLTVMRAAANAADLEAAAQAAWAACEQTSEAPPTPDARGYVDAGARGTCLLLDLLAGRAEPPPATTCAQAPQIAELSTSQVEVMYVIDCAEATGLGVAWE